MGRPKSFQPDEVLDRAVDVFWEKGYDGASVDDLTRAMGINRFSMYNTFGDKHQLFLKALEKHEDSWRCEVLPRVRGVRTLDGLRDHLYGNIDAVLAEHAHRCGCVMVLTAVTQAAHDEDSRAMVEEHQRAYIGALEEAFRAIEAEGELRKGMSAADAARFIALLAQGAVVSASGGQTKAMLRKSVRHAIDALRAD